MYQIKVKPNRMWVKQYEDTVQRMAVDEVTPAPHLLDRVAQVVCTFPKVFKQEQGYDWALDNSNDWKMSRSDDDPEVFIVAYRYGGGGNEEFMKALEVVLNHILE